ncbi:MAG: hypothetical protein D6681_03295 [Calditrichaeota bacterium]|nr:MAG: hypothetical protein D6681_03295 [Calditrichota bacterium]
MIRLGTTYHIISAPLHYALLNPGFVHPFQPVRQSLEDNCRDLLQGKLDVALISPLDFARHSSDLKLIGDIAVYTTERSRYALLFFRENLPSIHRVAVWRENTLYHLLARIVLNEFYEMGIEWEHLTTLKPVEEILETYEACLLEEEAAVSNYLKMDNYLDVVEEWHDKTGRHFVHQVMAVPRDGQTADFIESLLQAREVGMRHLARIAREHATTGEVSWDAYFDLLNEIFSFYPTEETWEHLREYFEYLFYYGIIDYMPSMTFC